MACEIRDCIKGHTVTSSQQWVAVDISVSTIIAPCCFEPFSKLQAKPFNGTCTASTSARRLLVSTGQLRTPGGIGVIARHRMLRLLQAAASEADARVFSGPLMKHTSTGA